MIIVRQSPGRRGTGIATRPRVYTAALGSHPHSVAAGSLPMSSHITRWCVAVMTDG